MEESEGTRALVMELVEGPTLADAGYVVRNDLLDFDDGTRARIDAVRSLRPTWSPNGDRLLVRFEFDGEIQLAWLAPRPGETAHPLTSSKSMDYQPGTFTDDGRSAVFSQWSDADQLGDIFVVDLDGGSPPRPILTGPGQQAHPQLSPSGRWMAFLSNASGREEIWVTDFPTVADRRQVSPGATEWAYESVAWGWLNDEELWWRSGEGHVVAARIRKGGRGIEVEGRRVLLGGRTLTAGEEVLA